MANEYYGDMAVTLPNQFQPIGDAFQGYINQSQRYDERNPANSERERLRREQQAQSNRLYNLREIDSDTDLTKFQTGEQAFDNYSAKELRDIKNNAIQNYVSLDPSEMEYRLSKDMEGFVRWHGAAKDQIKVANNQLQEFSKTYPVDGVKAHNMVYTQLAQDFMERDSQTGQWKRKPVEFVQPKDYVASLQTPEILSQIVNDTTGFAKHVQGLKPSTLSDKDFSNNKGFSQGRKWTAVSTPYSVINPNKEGLPEIDVKHTVVQGVKDVDGTPFKIIDDDVLANIMGDPRASASLYAMWGQEKPLVERSIGRPLNPAEEQFRFKNFAYKKTNEFIAKGAKEETTQAVPKITINNGGRGGGSGAGKGGEVMIDDLFEEISDVINDPRRKKGYGTPLNELSDRAMELIIERARKITGHSDVGYDDVYVDQSGDKISVRWKNNDYGQTGQVITSITKKGANLKVNTTKDVKQEVIRRAESTKPASTKKKKSASDYGLND